MTGSIAKLSAIQTRPLSGPCRAFLSQNVLCVTGLARHLFSHIFCVTRASHSSRKLEWLQLLSVSLIGMPVAKFPLKTPTHVGKGGQHDKLCNSQSLAFNGRFSGL